MLLDCLLHACVCILYCLSLDQLWSVPEARRLLEDVLLTACLSLISKFILSLEMERQAECNANVQHEHSDCAPHARHVTWCVLCSEDCAACEILAYRRENWDVNDLPAIPPHAPNEIIAAATTPFFSALPVWLLPYAKVAGIFAWQP